MNFKITMASFSILEDPVEFPIKTEDENDFDADTKRDIKDEILRLCCGSESPTSIENALSLLGSDTTFLDTLESRLAYLISQKISLRPTEDVSSTSEQLPVQEDATSSSTIPEKEETLGVNAPLKSVLPESSSTSSKCKPDVIPSHNSSGSGVLPTDCFVNNRRVTRNFARQHGLKSQASNFRVNKGSVLTASTKDSDEKQDDITTDDDSDNCEMNASSTAGRKTNNTNVSYDTSRFSPEVVSGHDLNACEICGRTFKYSWLKHHILTHSTSRPYECDLCSKNFKSRADILSHMKIHMVGDIKLQKPVVWRNALNACEICGRTFKYSSGLKRHMVTHSTSRPYECDYCSKNFKSYRAIFLHINKTHMKRDIKMQKKTVGRRPTLYTCEICGRTFKFPYKLKYHMVTHSTSRPYECDICSKKFKGRADIFEHIKMHINKDFKMQKKRGTRIQKKRVGRRRSLCTCDICGKTFRYSYKLKRHMVIHSTSRPYECDLCSKHFKSRGDIFMHIKNHVSKDDDIKCLCDKCGKFYLSGSYFNDHFKSHLQEALNLICDKCGQKFNTVETFHIHRNIHDNICFTCNECEKSFTQRSSILSHMRHKHPHLVGEGPKRYVCKVCNVSTINLIKHMVTHTRERKFHCHLCDKRFMYRYDLNKHLKSSIHSLITS